MELQAEDTAITLVLYGLDDLAVERGGDDPKALAEFFYLLVMGGKNQGPAFLVPGDLLLESSPAGKLDLVESETRESLPGKETYVRIGMPVGGKR